MNPIVTFAAAPDGVRIYRDGQLVAVVVRGAVPALLLEGAKVLQGYA